MDQINITVVILQQNLSIQADLYFKYNHEHETCFSIQINKLYC